MSIIGDMAHSLGGEIRNDARKVLLRLLLWFVGFLTGVAGFGFLTAWAYLALSMAVGHVSALLLIGLGLLCLAGVFLVISQWRPSKRDAQDPSAIRPEVPAREAPDAGSLFAFTAAFVLARLLSDRTRD